MTFEIWEWLQGDRNYWHGVKLLAQVAPRHVLLNMFKAECTAVNRALLEQALKAAKQTFAERQGKPTQPQADDQPRQLTRHDRARLLNKDLRRKYAERRALSNQFHDCKSDEERATLSDTIRAMIEEIQQIKAALAVFERTGELPPANAPAPTQDHTDADLLKAIKRLRTRISNQKKRIAEYDPAKARKSKEALTHALHTMQRELTQLNEEKTNRGL